MIVHKGECPHCSKLVRIRKDGDYAWHKANPGDITYCAGARKPAPQEQQP